MRTILKFISCFMAVFAVFELAVGLATADVAVMSIAVFLIWGAAMLHSLSRPKINFIYLFFLITFFVFLLSRVMVRWITEQEIYHPFTDQVMIHTYACLFISIVGLFVGSTLKVRFTFSSKKGTPNGNYYDPLNSYLNLDLLRQISGFLTTITGFATLVVNIEKIVYYGITGSGGELRISFASTLPSIVLRSLIYLCSYAVHLFGDHAQEERGYADIHTVFGNQCYEDAVWVSLGFYFRSNVHGGVLFDAGSFEWPCSRYH